jgi:PmbA protein
MDEQLREDTRTISTTSGVNQSDGTSAKVSSNGFTGTRTTTSIWMGTEVTLDDPAGGRPESWCWVGGRHRDQLWDPDEIADDAMRRGAARLGSTKGPTKKATMVVDPRSGRRLIGALLRSANARSIQQGRSFWADKQGQRLFSEALSITDDPLIVRGLASRLYDGEGISARALPIIREGVVQDVYVDTYYGRKAELAPTTGSSSNRVVHPGEGDLAGILADVGDAIYVSSWLGGNSDGTTGDFSFGLRGHLVEGGVVGAPVGEMNITGNLLDLFASLVRVGADPWPYSTTLTPTLVFEGVQFSGA